MREQQAEGLIGFGVDWMIRRSVRRNFRGVWWIPPQQVAQRTIFVANHHGWHDGYLMYHAVTGLGCCSLGWIAEFDSFPLFKYVGGMPFSAHRPLERAATIKRTIKMMQTQGRSLILFGEGVLHRPPELLPFGRSLKLICDRVPHAVVVPVAIRYEMSMHERPEAFLCFGEEIPAAQVVPDRVRLEVKSLLDRCALRISFERERFECLAAGTRDVNEKWDMTRFAGRT